MTEVILYELIGGGEGEVGRDCAFPCFLRLSDDMLPLMCLDRWPLLTYSTFKCAHT